MITHRYIKRIAPTLAAIFAAVSLFADSYEAENLTINAMSSSDIEEDISHGSASNGYYHLFTGNATNDYIEYTINITTPGTYNVSLRGTEHPGRGIYQLSIDGNAHGSSKNWYAASIAFITVDTGDLPLGTGNHTFRFDCLGKDASSGNFKLGLDRIDLTLTQACSDPTITQHPASQTVDVDDNVTFTVSATGTSTLSYQWLLDEQEISGATSSSYTITGVQLSDAGDYSCEVSDLCGSTTSNDATLSVNDPLPVYDYEVEDLTIAAQTAGDTEEDISNASASAGAFHLATGNATNDFIEYTVNVPQAGTYSISVRGTTHPGRGIYQLAVDSTNQGQAQNWYDTVATGFDERDLGELYLSAGNHAFEFTCTGKDASASNYKLGLDLLTLEMTSQGGGPAPGVFTLTSPSDTASNVPAATTLDWSDASDAVTYTLLVDDNSNFSSPVVSETGLTSSSYSVTGSTLDDDETYYWRVTAVNANGSTAASNNDFSFTTSASSSSLPGTSVLEVDFETVDDLLNYDVLEDHHDNGEPPYTSANNYYYDIPSEYPTTGYMETNQCYYPHTLQIVEANEGDAPNSTISGDQMVRFEMRPTDHQPQNSVSRAEIRTYESGGYLSVNHINHFEWYMYFPSNFNPGDISGSLILSQISANGAQGGNGGPQVTLTLQDPHDGGPYYWNVSVRPAGPGYTSQSPVQNATIGGNQAFEFDEAGEWVKFNAVYKYGPNDDGIVRVWMNDVLIGEKIGYVGHSATQNPVFKCGIYHKGTNTIVTFIDRIRLSIEDPSSSMMMSAPSGSSSSSLAAETSSAKSVFNASGASSRNAIQIDSIEDSSSDAIFSDRLLLLSDRYSESWYNIVDLTNGLPIQIPENATLSTRDGLLFLLSQGDAFTYLLSGALSGNMLSGIITEQSPTLDLQSLKAGSYRLLLEDQNSKTQSLNVFKETSTE